MKMGYLGIMEKFQQQIRDNDVSIKEKSKN